MSFSLIGEKITLRDDLEEKQPGAAIYEELCCHFRDVLMLL